MEKRRTRCHCIYPAKGVFFLTISRQSCFRYCDATQIKLRLHICYKDNMEPTQKVHKQEVLHSCQPTARVLCQHHMCASTICTAADCEQQEHHLSSAPSSSLLIYFKSKKDDSSKPNISAGGSDCILSRRAWQLQRLQGTDFQQRAEQQHTALLQQAC